MERILMLFDKRAHVGKNEYISILNKKVNEILETF